MLGGSSRRLEASRDGITDLTNNSHTRHVVKSVRYGVYSQDEIHRTSVIPKGGIHEIYIHELTLPKFCGVNDMRMGPMDARAQCPTCGNSFEQCTGHYGHIELATPVYHIGFASVVLMTLRSVCFWCSSMLIDKSDPKFAPLHTCKGPLQKKVRFNFVATISKGKTNCFACGGKQPQYSKGNAESSLIDASWDAKVLGKMDAPSLAMAKQKFTVSDARDILRSISREDCDFLGLESPENYIISSLIVPPPSIRPSITVALGSRAKGQDDITRSLKDIIKCNQEIKTKLANNRDAMLTEEERPTDLYLKDIRRLQACVSGHIGAGGDESGTATVASGGGKGRKKSGASLRKRLKGKNGRVRGQIMGKRVDFSARTVIKPDPYIDADEVTICPYFALTLTFPVKVTSMNIHILQKKVRAGPGRLDGAATVVDDKGRITDLKYVSDRDGVRLQLGWVVRRYIQEGDRVILNRQPSLHKGSMMVHRVHIASSGSTMGLNLTCVTPYNADFDGDEMNLYMPQSLDEVAELEGIMSVATNIVSPQSNKPVQGLVQDAIIGAFLLTSSLTRLRKNQMMNLCMVIKYYRSGTCLNVPPMSQWVPAPTCTDPQSGEPLWEGRQIIDVMLPRDLCLTRCVRGLKRSDSSETDKEERVVEIINGTLVSGRLCKDTLGTGSNSIVHIMYRDYGPDAAVRFMSDMMRVTNTFLKVRGFSMGLSDMITPLDVRGRVDEAIHTCLDELNTFTEKALDAGANPEQMEDAIMRRLQGAADLAGRIVTASLDIEKNRLATGVVAGAKGKMANMGQIMACVGQATVEGVRLKGSVTKRSLPCMKLGDIGPEACGFISNPYNVGLNPSEFFFHGQNGREGIVDTACKTATTGYTHRQLEKGVESLTAAYDGTVRDADESIIEFCYGTDGCDATHLIRINLPLASLSALLEASLENKGKLDDCSQALVNVFKTFVDSRRTFLRPEIEAAVHVPSDVSAILTRIVLQRLVRADSSGPLCTPEDLYTSLEKICIELSQKAVMGKKLRREKNWRAVVETQLVIRSTLTVEKVVVEHRLTLQELDSILDSVRRDHDKARVSPGEPVGSVAAEAVAEPMMQMTLNTFKFTGQSAQNVTQGVPRIQEIIHCTKNIKTPSMKLPLAGGFATCEATARAYGAVLPQAFLHTVIAASGVVFEPDASTSVVKEDAELVEMHHVLFGPCTLDGASSHVIRFEVDRQRALERGLTPSSIGALVQRFCTHHLSEVISSDVNMPHWVVRVRIGSINLILGDANSLGLDGTSTGVAGDDSPVSATSTDGDPTKVSPRSAGVSPRTQRLELERALLQGLQNTLLQSVCIGGVSGIASVVLTSAADHRLSEKTRFILETDGTCLEEALKLDDILWEEAVSNDICEIEALMGIEAAASVTRHELEKVIAFDNNYINQRHMGIVVNWMTSKGKLTPISRHGINHLDTGFLVKASFEETDTVLFEAAAFREQDNVTSVTASMCVHRMANIGTGAVTVMVNPQYKALCDAYEQKRQDNTKLFGSDRTHFGQNQTPSRAPVKLFVSQNSKHQDEDPNAWMDLSDSEASASDNEDDENALPLLSKEQRLERIRQWLWTERETRSQSRTGNFQLENCETIISLWPPVTATRPRNLLAEAVQSNFKRPFYPLSPVLGSKTGPRSISGPSGAPVLQEEMQKSCTFNTFSENNSTKNEPLESETKTDTSMRTQGTPAGTEGSLIESEGPLIETSESHSVNNESLTVTNESLTVIEKSSEKVKVRPSFIPMSPVFVDQMLEACARSDQRQSACNRSKVQPSFQQYICKQIHPLLLGINVINVTKLVASTTPSLIFDKSGRLSLKLFEKLVCTLPTPVSYYTEAKDKSLKRKRQSFSKDVQKESLMSYSTVNSEKKQDDRLADKVTSRDDQLSTALEKEKNGLTPTRKRKDQCGDTGYETKLKKAKHEPVTTQKAKKQLSLDQF